MIALCFFSCKVSARYHLFSFFNPIIFHNIMMQINTMFSAETSGLASNSVLELLYLPIGKTILFEFQLKLLIFKKDLELYLVIDTTLFQ